ncbi:MAG: lipase maturation factor family protein [Acidobacteriota bacterium]|nr:lipase maturation factor family protein [Acidobacteriota bacterium]
MQSQELVPKIVDRLRARGAYPVTEALFLRLLGLVYLAAFASLWPQIVGLIGSRGIVPAARLMASMYSQIGLRAIFYVPSLFWLTRNDAALLWLCALGCLASVLLTAGVFSRAATVACFALYLSLCSVGQPFTSFQWDALLLEAGFLAIFAGAPWLVWGYRFLLFRLMFESGWVKLASHDPNWRDFHALRFHFMTQPLPNPVAYYAHRLPAPVLDAFTVITLAVELIAPFLLFGPRRLRHAGAAMLILFQILILLTGNYAFFNLLALALCLWALDDRVFAVPTPFLRWRYPRWVFGWNPGFLTSAGNIAVLILLFLAALQLYQTLSPGASGAMLKPLAVVEPFEIVNSYGLFAVMTTSRPEIILEGSNDQASWREYGFPYKPGNTHRGLPWVAPYQPRLDWQMWFAALGDYSGNTWVGGLMYRIMTGEPSVAGLLSRPPFDQPPRYMRALLYQYEFTTPAERARSGAVWQRQLRGTWFGPVSLSGR